MIGSVSCTNDPLAAKEPAGTRLKFFEKRSFLSADPEASGHSIDERGHGLVPP
jgi:hypothetical protein